MYKQTNKECDKCLPKKKCVEIDDNLGAIKKLCITDEMDFYTSESIEECRKNLKKIINFED